VLFAFRRLSEKQKKFSASSAARASECERAVSLCLNINDLISKSETASQDADDWLDLDEEEELFELSYLTRG
jgi:hypothetical protein